MYSTTDSGLPFGKDNNFNHWHKFSEPRQRSWTWWTLHNDLYESMQNVKKAYRDLIINY